MGGPGATEAAPMGGAGLKVPRGLTRLPPPRRHGEQHARGAGAGARRAYAGAATARGACAGAAAVSGAGTGVGGHGERRSSG